MSSLAGRIKKWAEFVEERIAYWRFAQQVAEGAGLLSDVPYCAWKRSQFEELRECLDIAKDACERSSSG